MRTKTCFLPGRPSSTPLPHTPCTLGLLTHPTSLTTVHLLIRHRHPVADSSTVLPLEFSRVRVTSTQVHTLDKSTVAGDAVWTVATLDDRCHQRSSVLWTIMTRWVLFSALQCGEGRRKHWALRPQKPLRLIRDGEVGGSGFLYLTPTRYTVTTRMILH